VSHAALIKIFIFQYTSTPHTHTHTRLKAQLDRSELRLTSLKQHDLSDASLGSEKEALEAEDEDF
jgi:hypothetical protein